MPLLLYPCPNCLRCTPPWHQPPSALHLLAAANHQAKVAHLQPWPHSRQGHVGVVNYGRELQAQSGAPSGRHQQ
eukprot:1161474-Pelagomonas_calceolata.AAC.7